MLLSIHSHVSELSYAIIVYFSLYDASQIYIQLLLYSISIVFQLHKYNWNSYTFIFNP